jgi:hypothetical protein
MIRTQIARDDVSAQHESIGAVGQDHQTCSILAGADDEASLASLSAGLRDRRDPARRRGLDARRRSSARAAEIAAGRLRDLIECRPATGFDAIARAVMWRARAHSTSLRGERFRS